MEPFVESKSFFLNLLLKMGVSGVKIRWGGKNSIKSVISKFKMVTTMASEMAAVIVFHLIKVSHFRSFLGLGIYFVPYHISNLTYAAFFGFKVLIMTLFRFVFFIIHLVFSCCIAIVL